jgi:hypothetical protein
MKILSQVACWDILACSGETFLTVPCHNAWWNVSFGANHQNHSIHHAVVDNQKHFNAAKWFVCLFAWAKLFLED